ncbi:MAG: NAD(P)/FAD-dependent oxidoreductase, partial [Planctomycetales bacterium]
MYDVAIVGGGMAGMCAAARVQARGLTTIVFEAHGQPGGCAGFFRRKGFSFDVGATTLVDFEPGGIGGDLLQEIGMTQFEQEVLPGYAAWLPDRRVTLYRQRDQWERERLEKLGGSARHVRFWKLLDRLAEVFWRASRRGLALPLRGVQGMRRVLGTIAPRDYPLLRYSEWTMGDVLSRFRLREDTALVGLLSMLIEDTVHSTIDRAPSINSALGINIRGAGVSRAVVGMRGFWRSFTSHFRTLGGELRVGCPVSEIERLRSGFRVHTRRGIFECDQIVSALPANLTAQIAPQAVRNELQPSLDRDAQAQGGAIVVFLGVPEDEVMGHEFTHHQILESYQRPLGNGNNMFISVSQRGDSDSAPEGCRAVMVSTHCDLEPWENLPEDVYQREKQAVGERLLSSARRVYPNLGRSPLVCEVATPRTYRRFTRRVRGAVGGVRQSILNNNQNALGCETKLPGFWMVGDSTWPGLGTVAC